MMEKLLGKKWFSRDNLLLLVLLGVLLFVIALPVKKEDSGKGQEKENAELLQRQQEEDKLSVGVAVLSLLAILSAFADGIGFLNEIKEAGSLMNLCRENIAYPIVLVIVVLIGFVALVVCKDSAVRYWRSKRKALDRNVGE